ncbi:MAG: FAD-dependent thymidylate synthase, partial [Calditrichaceae bacterium]
QGFIDPEKGVELTKQETELHALSRKIYNDRLELGIAREQARKDLPLCTYTEAYWKIDLNNLLRFLRLRMDEHAQYEIRSYAETIGNEIVSKWCPLAWEAFLDYDWQGSHLSKMETQIIEALLKGNKNKAVDLAKDFGWVVYKEDGTLKGNLERREFEAKLKQMSIDIPW